MIMKRILSITTILLLAGLFFASCSSLSVTKRRYTKGYFVERHGRNHVQLKKSETAIAQAGSQEKQAPVQVVQSLSKTMNGEAAPVPVEKRIVTAQAPIKSNNVKKGQPSATDVISMAVKHPVKALKQAGTLVNTAATSDDALSLLWVVIVVILILYLLGLLFDGFGLGSLIHLLAVIAIVLLILWLLRII
jgi:hypothetical protein